jgi:hypothetical protein
MRSRVSVYLVALLLLSASAKATSEENAISSHIPRQPVESSVLATVGYSKRRHILEIEFSNGAIYRYVDVAPSVYRDLISSESKARYYDTNIKGNYRSVRIRAAKARGHQ